MLKRSRLWTNLQKKKASLLHEEINELMAKFAREHGMDYKPGTGRFSDSEYDITITFRIPAFQGSSYTREEMSEANSWRVELGVPQGVNVLGTRWMYNEKYYILDKISLRGKYPIIMHEEGNPDCCLKFPFSCIHNESLKLCR